MEIPRHWRLKAQRYRLEGLICPDCGQPIFPPRPVCANDHRTAQLAGIIKWVFPKSPASLNTFDVGSRIKHEVTERLIR